MIVVISLYSLKFSIASFRSFLGDTLYYIGYIPSTSDPDLWMRPAMKDDSFQYWEYVIFYVDKLLIISHSPLDSLRYDEGSTV